jgi:Flp pilus assembly protein TadG
MKNSKHLRKRQRGGALIEFTLLLPVLLLLALGTGDFARVFYYGIVTENAARAGAQYAIRNNYTNVTGIDNAAVQDTSLSPQFSSANVTEAACFLRCPGTSTEMACTPANLTSCSVEQAYVYVRVRTQYDFNTLINWPGIPPTTTLHGVAIMRVR